MILNITFLVVSTLAAGAAFFFINRTGKPSFRIPLVFAGAYLFSVTVIHILPELFSESKVPYKVGMLLLCGFFLQHILEYFTSGVEHGHMHSHTHKDGKPFASYSLLIALCFHALLEGALLSHPSSIHAKHESHTILFGIILHKMPAAFALMTVLASQGMKKGLLIGLLVVFAIMSPLGLLISNSVDFGAEGIHYLFDLVSGSFLHISTTIFVESSPGHRSDVKKMIALGLGVISAILVESL